ncbi:hypothetical protein MKJ04_11420 [Pontibacter sp. E15-1]|uniref:hypothetical protein n=1 Tax=Pontibacter sp. E15-1 TaxID=2919918 RepID=UPI001F4F8B79|nr:hypothetical protein [Pontibacter sp. E15-1]MCJ8165453.1 hypothetical protein [Pontibacter sp. E15-1]
MKVASALALFAALFSLAACNGNRTFMEQDDAEATIASETGIPAPLPKDILYVSKCLINGKLYARPSFDGTVLAYFDTSQQIYVIDTTQAVFVKARLLQDTSTQTGYIPKAILPERP